MRPSRKAATATSLAALNMAVVPPPKSPHLRAKSMAGNFSLLIGSKLHSCFAFQSMATIKSEVRSGKPKA
ncbi:unannotated protein [freshwater metagenome]|uniref:Unannotated protein n=1 Tax=freshwater metagenome TaxID=449393 RepID=A0A6J6Y0W6_9ZZZZ